jgi:uncharacterized membrane protein (DUF373 family)
MEEKKHSGSLFLKRLNSVFRVADYAILIIVAIGLIYLAGQLIFDAMYDAVFLWTQHTVPHLLSEMLFALIIMELFKQVRGLINQHKFSLNPFFYIGFIASVRGLLLTQMASTMGDVEVNQGMLQMGVYGGLILIMIVCYVLYNKYA